MRKLRVFLGAAVAALLSACTIEIQNTNAPSSSQAPPATPSASASPAPNCPKVVRIGVAATSNSGALVTTLRVAEVVRLDATPKDAQDNPVPAVCHAPTVDWALSGPCEFQGARTSFTPHLRGAGLGTCVATATVGGLAGSLSLTVLP